MIRYLVKFLGVLVLKIIYLKNPEKYEKAGNGLVYGLVTLVNFWILCILMGLVFRSVFCIIMVVLIPAIIAIWTAIEWSDSKKFKGEKTAQVDRSEENAIINEPSIRVSAISKDSDPRNNDATPKQNYKCKKCGNVGPYIGDCPKCGSSLKTYFNIEVPKDEQPATATKPIAINVAEGAELPTPSHIWLCPSCGNKISSSPCPYCGKSM